MSFSRVKSAGAAAGYYSGKDNYYVLGSLEARWEGRGAQALGLSGPVENDQLTRILSGRLPDGSALSRVSGGRETHRPGYDLTFSAPKSVSVMALAGGDRRLLAAHDAAVSAALREAETLAGARVTRDGVTATRLTGNVVAAVFTHDTSRDLDPQLHSHAVVANATLTEQGWRALASDKTGRSGFPEAVLANQIALGNLYRRALRQEVEALGYTTRESGKNGLWEMTDVPVKPFSQRRQAVLEAAGPDASARAMDMAALKTRRSKTAADPSVLLSDWTARLAREGFSPEAYRREADARAKAGAEPEAAPDPAYQAAAREAVGRAISVLSDGAVRFTYSDLLAKSAAQLEAAPGLFAAVRAGIDEAIRQDRLVPLDKEKGLFTSGAHLLNELGAGALVREILQEGPAAVNEKRAAAHNAPWSDAVSVLRQDRPRLAVIEGRGGAAVTRSRVTEVAAMARDMGRPAVVVAADRRSGAWLREGGADEAAVLAGRAALAEGLSLPAQATVIVDQAETLTLSQTLTLLEAAQRQAAQVVFMDTGRRPGTGNAPAVLKEAGAALYRAADGPAPAVSVVSEPDRRARHARLAEEYAGRVAAGEDVVAQAGGPGERKALTAAIRGALSARGLLGEGQTVEALTPVWLTAKTRRLRDSYREGMVMEQWSAEEKTLTRWAVARVGGQTNTLTLEGEDGARRTLKISQVDAGWSLYQKETLSVAPGDRLTVTAREARGQLAGGDAVEVISAQGNTLTVRKGDRTLALDASRALKLGHGYVSAPGGSVSATAHVLAAAARADLSREGLSRLARSGRTVSLYTGLEEARARSLLGETVKYATPLAEVRQPGLQDADAAIRDRQRAVAPPAEQAVTRGAAIAEGAHRSGITFSSVQLLDAAWGAADGVAPEALRQEIRRQVKTGELIRLEVAPGAGVSMLVRRSSYETERSIVRHIAEGKGAVRPLMDAVPPEALKGLTPGQREAAALILQSPDRFTAVQGYAGTGKTTQMRAVLTALEALPEPARPEVIGLGPTHRAVHEMQQAGVKAQTLASFLADERQRGAAGAAGRHANRLFLVDESSMTGNRDMAELYRLIAAGGGRAVMSGDAAQLKSPESGVPFAMQQRRSPVDVAVMKDIVRQTPALKPVVYSMIDGAYRTALAQAERVAPDQVPRRPGAWVPESSVAELRPGADLPGQPVTQLQAPRDVTDAMAMDYAGRTPEAQRDTIVITQTNEDRDAVNAKIHALRHAAGDTGPETHRISVLARVNTQRDALRAPEAWVQHAGREAFLDDAFWRIGEADVRAGVVRLEGEGGAVRLLSVRENSTQDVQVWARKTLEVSRGDRLRFSATDAGRGYVANSVWTLEDVDAEGWLTLRAGDATRVLDPAREAYDARIDLAYAVTTHGSQGASERFSISLQGVTGRRGSLASRDNSYVQLSRAKEHAQVYTDDREGWLRRMERAADRLSAYDVLEAGGDRQARAGSALFGRAAPLAETGLGRQLLRDAGLKGEFMGRFVAGTARYPVPHVALPLFDVNGREAGALLSEIHKAAGGHRAGAVTRRAGSEGGRFAGFQRSRDGSAVIADSWAEAEKAARANPSTGVLIRLEGKGKPWNMTRILGGEVRPALPTDAAARLKPPAPAMPEALRREAEEKERAERALAQAVERTARSRGPAGRDREQAAVREIARELSAAEQMRRIDRELVKEREPGEC